MIDDVQNRVGLPRFHPVLDRGQIGRGVEKRAVLFANQQRRVVAVEKDARSPRRSRGRCPLSTKIVDDAGQPIVIKTFAERVVERHAQPPVDALDVVEQVGRNCFQSDVFGIAACSLPFRAARLGRCRHAGREFDSSGSSDRRSFFLSLRNSASFVHALGLRNSFSAFFSAFGSP